MNLFEEYLMNAKYVLADDNYIADVNCMISKRYIISKVLNKFKNIDNIFSMSCNTIPYEKGKDFFIETGTECVLLPKETIGVVYNDRFAFDYKYIKMIKKQVSIIDNIEFFVIENEMGYPILKFFVNDEFIGCLMSIDMKYKGVINDKHGWNKQIEGSIGKQRNV